MTTEMTPAKDIREGGLVDLEGDRYADPHHNHPAFESEYVLVSSVTDETTAIAIGFEGFDVVGFPPDHLLSVKVAA